MDLIVGHFRVVIDMQHDFLDEGVPLEAAGGRDIIPALAATVAAARAAGVPVIYTLEAHRPGRVDSGREADPGMGKDYYPDGSEGRPPRSRVSRALRGIEIVSELACAPGDLQVLKRRYNCSSAATLTCCCVACG